MEVRFDGSDSACKDSLNSPVVNGTFTRRDFLEFTIAAVCALGLDRSAWSQVSSAGGVQRRKLGRTGETVSIIGLGGSHIGQQTTEAESIAIIRGAIDGGINFMDNCWDYHDGASEVRMGKALRDGYRQRVFLMTKIDGRDKQSAAKQIDESLRRLQTDHIDLMQFHEIIRMNDPDRIFAPGGAFEAVMSVKEAGKIRYVGFTGHKSPEIHLKMLSTAEAHGWTPDTVQMPLNVMDAHYDSFALRVLPELVKRNIGVLGMKPMGDKFILESKSATPVECLNYALSLPTSVVITGCDNMDVLQQALRVARDFKPLSKDQIATILAKTAPLATSGKFELYKSSQHFDGTAHHPEWLGKAA